jgi:mono/diheme cytochrome c family protein
MSRRLARPLLFVGLGAALAAVTIAAAPRAAAPRSAAPRRPAPGGTVPTFAVDVAPIFNKNCTVCHHVGGSGPFPLTEYDSAKAYTEEIREKIQKRHMPPWHAVGPRGEFRNDRRLSDADRATILRWLDTGAKPGDLRKAPPKPVYPKQMWGIGKPDVVLSMPTHFEVPARGTVEYQHFQVPTNFTEDRWVEAYEIMPGAREVVHHVQVYAKAPPPPPGTTPVRGPLVVNRAHLPSPPSAPTFASRVRALFARDTTPAKRVRPKQNFGVLIGSMAPGTNPVEFAPGTALRIKAGTVLTISMHYTAAGHSMKDRTSIGFRFAKRPPQEEVYASAFVNEVFAIPPGAKGVQIPAEIGVREPIKVWGLLPHTHVRGTRWLYKLQKPDGTARTILDIPEYDFNWQIYYLWNTPLMLNPGEKITSVAWYDNSDDNEDNPDPTKTVLPGEQTWDEMQYTGLLYSVPSRRVATTTAAAPAKR